MEGRSDLGPRTAGTRWPWQDTAWADGTLHALVWVTGIDDEAIADASAEIFGEQTPAAGTGFEGGRILGVLDAGGDDPYSHFGFEDGISQPYLGELHEDGGPGSERVIGGGLYLGPTERDWRPIALGEFLLGHRNEAVPSSTKPEDWSYEGPVIIEQSSEPDDAGPTTWHHNGTFVVFRRLDQHVERYADWIQQQLPAFERHLERQPRYRDTELNAVTVAAELTGTLIGRYPAIVPLVNDDGGCGVAPGRDRGRARAVGTAQRLSRPRTADAAHQEPVPVRRR